MNIQNITLGEHSFLVELYKDKIDLDGPDRISNEYVMLRNYEFRNSIIYDTEMYFIEKSIWNEYLNRLQNGKELLKDDLTSGLIFPIASMDYETFSLDIDQFNADIKPEVLKNVNYKTPLVYDLYRRSDIEEIINDDNKTEDELKPTKLYCNKLRIFHPHTTKNTNFIIHCDTYINNLHIHILARDMGWYTTTNERKEMYSNAKDEFQVNHNYYSEYVDVTIPDLDDIFGNDIFFIENLNWGDLVYIDLNSEETKKLKDAYDTTILRNNKLKFIYQSFFVYNIPFKIEKLLEVNTDNLDSTEYFLTTYKNEYLIDKNKNLLVYKRDENGQGVYTVDSNFTLYDSYVKHYIPEYMHTTAQAQMNYPISIAFVPYNKDYIYDTGKLSCDFPNLYDRVVYGFGQHNIMIASDDYDVNKDQFYIESKIKLISHIGFDEQGIISIINEFDYPEKGNKEKFPTFSDAYEYYNGIRLDEYQNIIDDEDEDGWWDMENKESMQCGVVFEIYKDKYQKDRVYKESYGFKSENGKLQIDDFSFALSSLFVSWSQYPGVLYLRCKFVDKYLGKLIFGNICTLTKENFKYLINNSSETNSIEIKKDKELLNKRIYNKTDIMDATKFNFLNNIQVKLVNNTNNISSNNSESQDTNTNITNTNLNIINNNKTKIIYKPIFYKVHDLQSIKLRTNITQNIGISLLDFMTKVETFKLVINGVTIVEYARNNNYVIFNINTNTILNATDTDVTSGEYHILNQDDEYLSSGNWYLVS